MNKLKTKLHCHLCGRARIELVADRLRYKSLSKAYRCKDCGLVFLFPRMTQSEEQAFYEKEYGNIYSREKGTTPEDLFKARRSDARLYYKLSKDFINKRADCLEIGCASGYFLHEIKNKVRSVVGVESHQILKRYCQEKGITMYDSLDLCPIKALDIVFLFFVLEHIGDPIDFLKRIILRLKKKGAILLTVPNNNDALITLYNVPAFKDYYYTPAHQFYYTESTLRTLFRKAGFQRYDITTIQRYDLSNHMHWMMHGKPGGMGKFKDVFSTDLNERYKKDLIEAGKGDTLLAVVHNT
jgi:2-polyprenyl-3-methyl-5-hydroxy-6-metoxy-1,4-benzoquinol methylase